MFPDPLRMPLGDSSASGASAAVEEQNDEFVTEDKQELFAGGRNGDAATPLEPDTRNDAKDEKDIPSYVVSTHGIADGDLSIDTPPLARPEPGVSRNHWVDNGEEWIFWKLKPTKGLIVPRFGISARPRDSGPAYGTIVGKRRTEAVYADGTTDILEDWYAIDDAIEGERVKRIRDRHKSR